MVSLPVLISSFLFPRVKSEAIVARREPKEEVEDVSSYLCTELVYDITKMPAGKGGWFTYLYCFMYTRCIHVFMYCFMYSEMQIDVPLLAMRARVVNGLWLMSMESLYTTFKPESGTEEQLTQWQYHCAGCSFCSWVLEHCPAQYHPNLELKSCVQWGFSQDVMTVRLLQKSLSPCWQWRWSCEDIMLTQPALQQWLPPCLSAAFFLLILSHKPVLLITRYKQRSLVGCSSRTALETILAGIEPFQQRPTVAEKKRQIKQL